MKTEIRNFANRIDEIIPEATPESIKGKTREIGGHAKDTGKCATATVMCAVATTINAYRTLEDSAMLGLMISKTTTKKMIQKIENFYTNDQIVIVRR